jgi:hypothetical protein
LVRGVALPSWRDSFGYGEYGHEEWDKAKAEAKEFDPFRQTLPSL